MRGIPTRTFTAKEKQWLKDNARVYRRKNTKRLDREALAQAFNKEFNVQCSDKAIGDLVWRIKHGKTAVDKDSPTYNTVNTPAVKSVQPKHSSIVEMLECIESNVKALLELVRG